MAEKTLPEPINGKEYCIIVADNAQQATMAALQHDCYLQGEKTYFRFGGTVTVRGWIESPAGRVEVNRDITFGDRERPAEVQEFAAERELDYSSPNEARIETGQPVPTLTKDEQGRPVVKGVHYARRKRATK